MSKHALTPNRGFVRRFLPPCVGRFAIGLLFVMVGLLTPHSASAQRNPGKMRANTEFGTKVFFVKDGKPLLIDERSILGVRRPGYGFFELQSATLQDAPQYQQYYISIGVRASRSLAEGDFYFRARLGLAKRNNYPGPVVLSLQVGMQFFDFVFRDGRLALQGIQLDSTRSEGGDQASLPVALDGKPFTLELIRRGSQVEIQVNGRNLTRRKLEPTSGDLAITVERDTLLRVTKPEDLAATLRIYDFEARGRLVEKSAEEVEWDRMVDGAGLQIKRVGGAYRYVEDRPKYPNVLLIGDSISLYYTDPVRRRLKARADVFRTPMGPGKVETLFRSLDEFLGLRHWDIIHFNTGLHDFGLKQGTPEEVAAYRQNLEIVIGKLKKTGARLIWASTTPVPPNSAGTSNELAIRYNQAAAEVMERHDIPMDDLHSAMMPYHEKYWLAPRNVHFNPSGSAFLGDVVAARILRELDRMAH